MIVQCDKCKRYLDDEFRTTICPHDAFPANDGHNHFRVNDHAYLSDQPPMHKMNPHDWLVMKGIPNTRMYSGTQLAKLISEYMNYVRG